MNGRGFITISMHKLERMKIIESVMQRRLTIVQAVERLRLCERQVSRLVRRYEAAGPAALVAARRGQPGNRELPVDRRARAMVLVRERYADFGPTLACEKLRECHGITPSKETVRHLMTDAGLWIPRRQRSPWVYQPRARRACVGELVQIDGSDHRWFEDRAPACTLLVYVDDATSRLRHCTSRRPSQPSAISRRCGGIWNSTASRWRHIAAGRPPFIATAMR